LWQVRLEPVMSKQLHTAHAAWAGRSAAMLAASGFTGPEKILEGERGFFKAMCADANTGAVLREESDWLIHQTSFKPWPACRHTHATIDCVLALRRQAGGTALSFDGCEVESFNDALTICDNPNPRTRTEAKFSLQYCVAATVALGELRPEHFDEEFFLRPDLVRAAQQVRLKPSERIHSAYPDHYGARVTIFVDRQARAHEVRDSLGDPERPMSREAVLDKARSLMVYGGVASARLQQVLDAAAALLEQDPAAMEAPFPAALLDPLFEAPTA
jgi:2-methylcitrate dehydratase PrpD